MKPISSSTTQNSGTTTATHFTFSIQKILLLTIILTVTISFSTALEISFDAPNKVKINEPFIVRIRVDSQETFDVKVFVHTSEDNKISRGEYISEMLSASWKTSWNYILASYPKQEEYSIKVLSSEGKREICVRLRKSETKTTSLKCDKITVEAQEENQEEPKLPKKDEQKQIVSKQKRQNISQGQGHPQIQKISSPTIKSKPQERIILNTPTNKETFTTKQGKIRSAILYSFTSFLVILIILLALRKL